jgi:flagellar biosynthetic protein FliR
VTTIDASALLAAAPVDAVVFIAVFSRLGAMMMTTPSFGDMTISPQIRLALALAATLALATAAAPHYSRVDVGPAALAALIFGELAIGAFIGLSARAVAAAMATAGQIASFQMGLSHAQIFDPNQHIQSALVGGFLSILGVTLIFATDLHHSLVAAILGSYGAFAPGLSLDAGSLAESIIAATSDGFALGVRLAAPFIVFGLVFYAGAGVLNRLMPQAQAFFTLMPANVILGLALLMLTTGAIAGAFLEGFADHVALLAP